MSFGFGVGDFLAVIELANKIRKDFSGAPEQLQNIAAEVRSLAGILQDVDTYLAGHEINAVQEERLGKIEENCKQVLDDIEKFVNKNSSLQTDRSGTRQRMKRIWQRIKWDPDDTRDLRQRLTSNLAALTVFTESVTSENVAKLVVSERERRNHEILDWLAPLDYIAQHSDHLRDRLAGTGQWLVESSRYQKWLHDKSQLLFLHGIPGAGKTVLSSMIIDSLQNQCQIEKNTAVCYFYCDYRRQKEQQLDKIMLRLLRQLAHMTPILPPEIQNLYQRHRKCSTMPTLDDARIAFLHVARSFSMAYIVIDALDECQTTDNCQGELIDLLIGLYESGYVNISITSRPIPNIQNRFSSYESIEIRASSDDIGSYVEKNLQNLPKFVANNPDLQQEIKSKVTANVDGMFLLAKLYIDSMKGKRSTTQLRRMLDSLVSGPNSYKEAYTKTMEGIQGQIQDQVDIALEVLMWTVYSGRPLTSKELLHALAVEIDAKDFDKDNIPDLDDTISACCGLVTVEAESELVRLVHYTTQEFFESDDGLTWLKDAQLKLTQKCITYLSFDEFSSGICRDIFSFRHRLGHYSFYDYSSRFWGTHAKLCGDTVSIRQFLSREQQSQASSQMQVIEDAHKTVPFYFNSEKISFMSPLAMIAHFGLQDMLYDFLDKHSINAVDDKLRTPLSYAAANGHVSLVQLLLKEGAEIGTPDQRGRTPLQWAAYNGHTAVVSILLASEASIDSDERTKVLLIAVQQGYNAVLNVLFEHGADVQDSNEVGHTTLHMAAGWGREDTVMLLISKGALINVRDKGGETPLMVAVDWRSLSIPTLLLKNGADVNIKDNRGETALMKCCSVGEHSSMTRLLIDQGAEIAAADNSQRSALHHAAERRRPAEWSNEIEYAKTRVDNVRQLLDHGADLLGITGKGWTALDLASKSGRLGIVHLLVNTYRDRDLKLDLTAVLDVRDEHGRNILHHIAFQNDLDLFGQFIQFDLSSRLHDKYGKSVLDYAVISGSEEMVLFVLDNVPFEDLAAGSDLAWSPLHWACRQGTFNMIKLLVTRGYTTRTSKTTFPDASWAPFDVAVLCDNSNLISYIGNELNSGYNWHDIIASGAVIRDTSSNNVVAVRANSLELPIRIVEGYFSDGYCSGCIMPLPYYYVSCHNCGDYYCFMCAKDASSICVKGRNACFKGGACEDTCINEHSDCSRRVCNRSKPT